MHVCICIYFKVVYSSQAVQDFGSMCQERDAEEVKGVLPYWPRIYCKISVVSCLFVLHMNWFMLIYISSHNTIPTQPPKMKYINVCVCEQSCGLIIHGLSCLPGPWSQNQGGNSTGFWATGVESASQLGPLFEEPDGPLDPVSVWHLHPRSLCRMPGLPGCFFTRQTAWGSQLL